MNSFDACKIITGLTITLVMTGCGGYGGGMAGNPMATSVLGSVANSALGGGGMGSNVLSAIIQSMGSNVLNGQIGSQVSQADQSFRLQQLGSMVQSGAITQPQQWVNPQTGNTLAITPVGQQSIQPQSRQTCQNLEESAILANGQRISEMRLACLNPQTGKWSFVQ